MNKLSRAEVFQVFRIVPAKVRYYSGEEERRRGKEERERGEEKRIGEQRREERKRCQKTRRERGRAARDKRIARDLRGEAAERTRARPWMAGLDRLS